jgi:hypothetical protein
VLLAKIEAAQAEPRLKRLRAGKGAEYLCQAFFNITVLLKSTFGHATVTNPASLAFLIVSSNADCET